MQLLNASIWCSYRIEFCIDKDCKMTRLRKEKTVLTLKSPFRVRSHRFTDLFQLTYIRSRMINMRYEWTKLEKSAFLCHKPNIFKNRMERRKNQNKNTNYTHAIHTVNGKQLQQYVVLMEINLSNRFSSVRSNIESMWEKKSFDKTKKQKTSPN